MSFVKKIMLRSKWLAKRLWMVVLAEVLLVSWRHWHRLDAEERVRLFELAKKSKGRPKQNLSARERREADDLLDKAGHIEYAGSVAGIVLPFRPVSRIMTRFLAGRRRDQRAALEAGDGAAPEPEPKAGAPS